MIWIVAALILGIFLNKSTVAGTSWPIGSIIAVVIMGIYIKINQDKRFDELKSISSAVKQRNNLLAFILLN